jgi:hypothetical protein
VVDEPQVVMERHPSMMEFRQLVMMAMESGPLVMMESRPLVEAAPPVASMWSQPLAA